MILHVLLISASLSALITGYSIYSTYIEQTIELNTTIEAVQNKNIKKIAQALWKFDQQSLDIYIEGFTNIPAIVRVDIYDEKNNIISSSSKKMFLESGYKIKSKKDITINRSKSSHKVGSLILYISHHFIYDSMLKIFFKIFLANILKTLFISILMLIIFKREVTDHLHNITKNVERIIAGQNISITTPNSKNFTDEIQDIVHSIDKMYKDFRSHSIQSNQKIDDIKNHVKFRDMFWAQLNHDIRTPLNGLISESSWIQESSKNLDIAKSASKITKYGEAISLIADKMLLISVEQKSSAFYSLRTFKLIDLIEDIKEFSNSLAKKQQLIYLHKVNIQKQLSPIIHSDYENLKRVLNILISNAFKYTSSGKIEFSCSCTQSQDKKKYHVDFEISDTGSGISKERLAHIYDIFYSSDVYKPTDANSGFGFSLCITRQIVDTLGGNIRIESKMGVGTQVFLSMQFIKGTEISTTEKKLNFQDLQGKSILIVDDTIENRLVLSRIIKKINPSIITEAADGLECINEYKKSPYDIVFMDLQMPNMDGISAMKNIRLLEEKKNLHSSMIIVCTAFSRIQDKEISMKAGGDFFISKPVNRDKIYHIFNRIIELNHKKL